MGIALALSLASCTEDLGKPLARYWQILIGGQFLCAVDSQTMQTQSPYDGKLLAEVPLAGPADIARVERPAQRPGRSDPGTTARSSTILPGSCCALTGRHGANSGGRYPAR